MELIKSRQINLTCQHAESLFLTSTLIKAIQHSPVIGLHMYGKNILHVCSQVSVLRYSQIVYYIIMKIIRKIFLKISDYFKKYGNYAILHKSHQ